MYILNEGSKTMQQSIAQNFNNRIKEATRIPRKISLMQILHDDAEKACEVFPQLDKLLVLHIPTWGEPLYASPQMAAQLPPDTVLNREMVAKIGAQTSGTAAFISQAQGGTSATLIALVGSRQQFRDIFPDGYTEEMAGTSIQDLALGKLIFKNSPRGATISSHEAESAAEAFAMLRHIQRFGKDTAYLTLRREVTAAAAVLRSDTDHYTTDSLEQAVKVADKLGDRFPRLLLRDTASLAAKIAAENHLDAATLEKIRNAYHPVAEYLRGRDPGELPMHWDATETHTTTCRKIIKVMSKHRADADIFKAGQRFLSHPETQQFLSELARDNIFWKTAAEFVNKTAHEKPRNAKYEVAAKAIVNEAKHEALRQKYLTKHGMTF